MLVLYNTHLSSLRANDAYDIVEYMRDKEIYNYTLRIPYPYKLEHAQDWIEDCLIFEEENGAPRNFAIRLENDKMIGLIGFQFTDNLEADNCEFGYWLAKAYWNKGIMTEVIKKFCVLAKESYHIKTLKADVFAFNTASQKVLLKTGFKQVEVLPDYYNKDGRIIDAIRYTKEL